MEWYDGEEQRSQVDMTTARLPYSYNKGIYYVFLENP